MIADLRSFLLKARSERGDQLLLHHILIDQFIINWLHVTGLVLWILLAPCMIFYNSTPSMYLFLFGACSEKRHKNNVFQIIQMIHYTNLLTLASEIMICCMGITDCIFSCNILHLFSLLRLITYLLNSICPCRFNIPDRTFVTSNREHRADDGRIYLPSDVVYGGATCLNNCVTVIMKWTISMHWTVIVSDDIFYKMSIISIDNKVYISDFFSICGLIEKND